ncbi:VanZ family protein [Hymenobacter fodinae]|uniref:VanZ-like domain-containing protein n=1 Tax=Hymenobacter fodinae TaxID=2510796 RepID=A0A4Z0P2M9_9BACT|nr:VanZ family protein [Hymenobacter fodinae]TGE04304.1 hypothetical protein EU556_23860 [Hymenobacter fodinae]
MRLGILLTLLAIGTLLVLYLSWLPLPKLSSLWFMPGWLGQWADADRNDKIRTGIPFVFLGLLVGAWLIAEEHPWPWWGMAFTSLVAVVVIAELGQLFLPQRFFDWGDIGWGVVGAAAGLGLAAIVGGYQNRIKAKHANRR